MAFRHPPPLAIVARDPADCLQPTRVGSGSGESPGEVRIATVAYSNGGKVGYNGAAGIIEQNGWLRGELAKETSAWSGYRSRHNPSAPR
jgi:hypothetical protein